MRRSALCGTFPGLREQVPRPAGVTRHPCFVEPGLSSWFLRTPRLPGPLAGLRLGDGGSGGKFRSCRSEIGIAKNYIPNNHGKMWNWLCHLEGSILLEGSGSDQIVLEQLARFLKKQHRAVNERGESFLKFDDPLGPFSPNWVAMVAFHHGKFWIEQNQTGRTLWYKLSSRQFLVFGMFVYAVFLLISLVQFGFLRGIGFGFPLLVLGLEGQILLGRFRTRAALRKVLRAE